ncbi:heavy-metal-associated domain-containing protein [Bradymonas sediminis]|uniref:Uncharacterized protein n=1 Tax=Bradymonas sediminis TaxID=1548548 RepID=A0A2Z4FRL3_9DELT|nr:heavy metal-associated domain-containing protein [Bradymonas sediminis]AWV91308.1 hypothetical protein DN745_19060 [Bradymonas sediminis]TDP73886.1 copper chaperone CopZ [Bradymonas sediminis]
MKTLELSVAGMSCGGCANAVRTMLSQKLGVDRDRVEVSAEAGTASVKLDSAPTPEQLESALQALKEQDFPASIVQGLG